jgi:hypothetical protein
LECVSSLELSRLVWRLFQHAGYGGSRATGRPGRPTFEKTVARRLLKADASSTSGSKICAVAVP